VILTGFLIESYSKGLLMPDNVIYTVFVSRVIFENLMLDSSTKTIAVSTEEMIYVSPHGEVLLKLNKDE
jgi:hypothetical protein